MAIRTEFFSYSPDLTVRNVRTIWAIRTVRSKLCDLVRFWSILVHNFSKKDGFWAKMSFFIYSSIILGYQNSFFLQIGCLYPFSCLTKLASRSDEFLSWKYHRIRIFDDSKEPRAISTLGAVESIRSILEHHPLNLLLRRKWWIDGTKAIRRNLEDKRY